MYNHFQTKCPPPLSPQVNLHLYLGRHLSIHHSPKHHPEPSSSSPVFITCLHLRLFLQVSLHTFSVLEHSRQVIALHFSRG